MQQSNKIIISITTKSHNFPILLKYSNFHRFSTSNLNHQPFPFFPKPTLNSITNPPNPFAKPQISLNPRNPFVHHLDPRTERVNCNQASAYPTDNVRKRTTARIATPDRGRPERDDDTPRLIKGRVGTRPALRAIWERERDGVVLVGWGEGWDVEWGSERVRQKTQSFVNQLAVFKASVIFEKQTGGTAIFSVSVLSLRLL